MIIAWADKITIAMIPAAYGSLTAPKISPISILYDIGIK